MIAERALRGDDGRAHLRLPAHDRRRPVPPRPVARRLLERARARSRRRRARPRARLLAPEPRSTWDVDGWVTVAPDAPDSAIDALVGVHGRFDSSARFEGRPGFRASSAFDGTPKPWIGSWQDGRRTWIEWTGGADACSSRSTRSPACAAHARVRDRRRDDRRRRRRRRPAAGPGHRARSGWRSCAPRSRRARRERSGSAARSASPRSTAGRPARCRAPARHFGLRRVRADGRRGRGRRERDRARPPTSTPAARCAITGVRRRSTLPAGETRLSAAPGHLHALRAAAALGTREGARHSAGPRRQRRHRDPRRPQGRPPRAHRPRPAGPRRELHPRPPRELRRQGPRRRPRSATRSAPPGASPRPAGT